MTVLLLLIAILQLCISSWILLLMIGQLVPGVGGQVEAKQAIRDMERRTIDALRAVAAERPPTEH